MPPPSRATASTLTASMRRLSENCPKVRGRASSLRTPCPPACPAVIGPAVASGFFVSVTNAIEGLDMAEIVVDHLEFLPKPLDVAVDGAIVDVDVLTIGRIHQLVAVLDVAGPCGKRFQDQELGHRELDLAAAPGAEMPARVEQQL